MINTSCGPRYGKLVMDDKSSKLHGRVVTILRTTADEKKYIVEIEQETGPTQKFKVAPTKIVFTADTPITLNDDGEEFTAYVDSFDEKNNSYKIFAMSGVSENDAHCYIDAKRRDVTVMFADPIQRAFLMGMM